MTYEEISRKYIDAANAGRKLCLNYLEKEDIEVCKYMKKHIPNNIDISDIYLGNQLSLEKFINRSLDEISIFGLEFVSKIKELLSNVSIDRNGDDLFSFCTYVIYLLNEDDSICFDSGRVDSYHMPSELFEISVFDFSHEHIHSLKDVNYYEYVNAYVLGETIPMFYELVSFNSDDIFKRDNMKTRLYFLNNNKNVFVVSDEIYNMVSVNEKYLHEYIRSMSGCYLNSFYYATILYNMYKETPKKILGLVSGVLKHNITTKDMLELLGVYGDIRGEVFEGELGQIKRILRI